MKKRLFSVVVALALCLGMLPGTVWAEEVEQNQSHNVRTEQLVLTREPQTSEEEGWSWEVKDSENGIFTLTLDNVDFEVADNTAISFLLIDFVYSVNIVLKGENRIISANDTDAIYNGCGIYLPADRPTPIELTISGGGSLTVEGKRYGINLSAGTLEVSDVTISAESDKINGLDFNSNLTIKDSHITTNTLSASSLTVQDSTITAHMEEPYYSTALITANCCEIADSTLTLTGPEDGHAYAAIWSSAQNERTFTLTNSCINARNVEHGLYIQFGTINLNKVEGTLICSNYNQYMAGHNTAFFANIVNSVDCAVFAMGGINAVVYGSCALPEDIQELTIDGTLNIQDGGTFTIGQDQNVIFTRNPVVINNAGSATLVNNGTLEFSNGAPTIYRTVIRNNGTLIAPEGIFCDHTNLTNNGTYDGFVKENSGTTMYAYGAARHNLGAALGIASWGTYRRFITPGGTLIIPNGKTVDASKSEMGVTWETLSEYLSVAETGQIVVEEGGTLLLPDGITQEMLDALHISGEGTIKIGGVDLYKVTFQDGDTELSAAYVVPDGSVPLLPLPQRRAIRLRDGVPTQKGQRVLNRLLPLRKT